MLRNHAFRNLGSVDVIVNGLATVVAVALIAAAYFSAIGQIALA
ncbi:MAG: hypothetical protein R3C51_07695 [Parvularculaceae bacterium]